MKKIRPGFASEEEPERGEAEVVEEVVDNGYGSMPAEEVDELWAGETLCARCLHLSVCTVASSSEPHRAVVSRCASWLGLPPGS